MFWILGFGTGTHHANQYTSISHVDFEDHAVKDLTSSNVTPKSPDIPGCLPYVQPAKGHQHKL
eukprot:1171916-Prorocentrum_lima.AAC.1